MRDHTCGGSTTAEGRSGRRAGSLFLLAALVGAFILFLVATPRAEAFVYWTNFQGDSIGRANNDGTGVNQTFIMFIGHPRNIVVDDYHIYWSTWNTIGRAGLDGTNANVNFITGCQPQGLAIYNDHLYWADYSGYIGRATTSGTGIDRTWINCKATPDNLTQHAGYFYWSWRPAPDDVPFIARCNPPTADGGTVNYTSILGDYWVHSIQGICATSSHLYWRSDEEIGRASTPYGLSPDRNYITGLAGAGGMTVYDDHIYYTTLGSFTYPDSIGRVGTGGGGLNNALITGCSDPTDVDVDGHSAPTSVLGVARDISAADLPTGLATPLVRKLRSAKAALDRDQPKVALNIIDATVGLIRAQSGKHIPSEQAERWVQVLGLIKVHII